ncbi:putative disease resistance RPP13-like protein 1 [Neltuma alba]|uniref:putative disease resistance RPP13-like protein 1 n=1 Tax=Neltuma alba TaxID=207710 RepID=UPI0010A53425|nr:putative disease resistance RPP13-like protein 1 [Prosopis alba]
MANKLEAMIDRIERIVGQKNALNLEKSTGTETLLWRPAVTSHVDVSEVCGRKKEKEDIIKLMFNVEGGPLSVIPIVGMGRVGKTTLVNLVYNDEDVRQKFDLTVWDLSALKIVPESIGKFIHLCYLDLSETCIESLPDSIDTPLKAMPRGLGNIKDLQFLSDFVVGREQEASIGELGEISNLKGIIKISKLENVKNGNEACDARMIEKKHIKSLTSSWVWYDDVEDTRTERDILGNLQPYWDLEELEIHHYRGTIFPDWTAAPNLSPTSKDLAWSQAGENVRRKAVCFFKKASHLGLSVA